MIKKSLALFALSLTVCAGAQAAALEQFKAFVASTKSARGEFAQKQVKKADAKGKVSPPSSGSFVFARPGKFVWTYQKPYEQVLQADGEQLYVYDKDLNQVTIRKLGDALGSSPAAILFGSNDLEKNFTLADAGQRDGMEWLKATPKAKDASFDSVLIGLKNGVPGAMELVDSFGQTSVITFTRFEKNPSLPAGQFSFVMPKGADVFRH
ncbi:MAG TPA: outer membrane lipoprotein chaperone LolA [Telluria sp.]|nr:outer membrane lipoprotein chaperone LolA [Telluria sp.]